MRGRGLIAIFCLPCVHRSTEQVTHPSRAERHLGPHDLSWKVKATRGKKIWLRIWDCLSWCRASGRLTLGYAPGSRTREMPNEAPARRGVLRRFRDWNVALSWATTPTQLWETRGLGVYAWIARAMLGHPGTNDVIDVGAGRTWYFGKQWWSNPKFRLVGIDIDATELDLNPDLDQRITTDACQDFGLPDASADLVLCRAVVEHLQDTSFFLQNLYKVLRPGGVAVLSFSNPLAPPILINRMLPRAASARLLAWLVPGSEGLQGFQTYYDKCLFSTFYRECKRLGFSVDFSYSGFYSSSYFMFFFPVHLLSIAVDLLRQTTMIRNLGSTNVFMISKPL